MLGLTFQYADAARVLQVVCSAEWCRGVEGQELRAYVLYLSAVSGLAAQLTGASDLIHTLHHRHTRRDKTFQFLITQLLIAPRGLARELRSKVNAGPLLLSPDKKIEGGNKTEK